MPDAGPLMQLAAVVRGVDPRAVLRRAWPLAGGVSSQMTGLEVARGDGQVVKWVLRRLGAYMLAHNPHALAQEIAVLAAVRDAGVPAPQPLYLDETRTLLPEAYLVLAYVEGASVFDPAHGEQVADAVASYLATLHRASIDIAALDFLPRAAQQVIPWRDELDEALQEGRIRAALAAMGPPPPRSPRLLHGDCWPGNLLWQEGRLVAVVDWEDAKLGDPLFDLAISRLDALWVFGRAAMHHLTHAYAAHTGHDLAGLPYWDLVAALRPCGQLAGWAAVFPAAGRPDITVASMTADHAWFVDQATDHLETRPSP